ncbi:MAG: hypothetical protein IJH94_01795 [Clostridia bacterium]|nr:hypothetical protein [Clostridia bacterium]
MRVVKHIIWLVLLTVAQSVLGRFIKIYGCIPDLLAGYSIITAFCTKKEKEAAYVMLAAGILSGSCVGRIFPATVFYIGIGSAAAWVMSEYFRFTPALVRISAVVLLTASAVSVTECFVSYRVINKSIFLYNILPFVLYTTFAACVIYPLVVRTMYRKSDKKLMLI